MPKKNDTTNQLVFHIEFKKGKANRNRLPIKHVLDTLQQLDLMVKEVGKKIQRDNGVENPDGDFGIELLAGATGLAVKKGSLRTAALATRDLANAERTLRYVIGTTANVEKKKVGSIDEYGAPVVRRLATIGEIQEQDRTELHLRLADAGKVVERSKFSERGIDTIRSLGTADLTIESVTIYGKLRKLADFGKDDDVTALWGELTDDGGETWRIKFPDANLKKVMKLFTKQVVVDGDANYFKTRTPRLDAKTIEEDKERNYIKSFKAFRRNYSGIFGKRDPQDILKDIRG